MIEVYPKEGDPRFVAVLKDLLSQGNARGIDWVAGFITVFKAKEVRIRPGSKKAKGTGLDDDDFEASSPAMDGRSLVIFSVNLLAIVKLAGLEGVVAAAVTRYAITLGLQQPCSGEATSGPPPPAGIERTVQRDLEASNRRRRR